MAVTYGQTGIGWIAAMAKIKICKEVNCKNAATTKAYCRLHYLRNWKQIKEEEHKKAAKRLNSYILSVCKRHPDRYLEVIKESLRSSSFDQEISRMFDDDDDEGFVLDEPTYEEEIERLIDELKIEKGF